MKNTKYLRDIMRTSLLTLLPGMEINKAMRLLLDRDVSGAPVLDNEGRIAGVLTQKDCLKAAVSAHYHHVWGGQVADYMTESVVTLDANLDLMSVANFFINSGYRRFPVLDQDKLVGQISRSDLLQALNEQWH